MFKINGVDVPTPSKYEPDIEDIDGETNRNGYGDMLRDRIAVKRKLILEWPPLTYTQMMNLLKAVKDVYFTVTYPDPELGEVTKTMYVGPRKAAAYSYDKTTKEVKWKGLAMNFIEK